MTLAAALLVIWTGMTDEQLDNQSKFEELLAQNTETLTEAGEMKT